MTFKTLRRLMASYFFNVGPLGLLLTAIIYGVLSYVGLMFAGELELVKLPSDFVYWLVVTASTVGYGDISPVSVSGKWFTALWVIPVGLSVFTLIIARTGFYLSELSSRGRKGLKSMMHSHHTIIIGWNGSRTIRLINILKHKDNRELNDVVLCVTDDMENPLPHKIDFVKVDGFTDEQTMARTNLSQAARIIIDTRLDDVTLAAALFCEKHSPDSHKTAYFQDESLGDILVSHCPHVEVVPSVAVEMLVKSSIDPGSSLLHKQLLDGSDGMTQYSVVFSGQKITVREAFSHFRERYDATLIAIKKQGETVLKVNPPLDLSIESGDTIHYVADARIVF